VGFQGGTAEGAGRLFSGCAPGTVLPNVSRSLLVSGPDVNSLREAAARECATLGSALR
jgi:hypothetical protein